MRNITFLLVFTLLLTASVSANLGTVKQNDCIDLYQYCPSCSYVNLTAVKFPNATVDTMNLAMTKTEANYYYSYCSTGNTGEHFYTVCGDKDGTAQCEEISFYVAKSGLDNSGLWQVISITALLMTFNIMVVYRRSKVLGGIIFIISGVALMLIEPFLGFAGLIMLIGGSLITIIDLMPKKASVSSGRWLRR